MGHASFTAEEWEHLKQLLEFEVNALTILSTLRDLDDEEIERVRIANSLQEKMGVQKNEKENNLDL